MIGQQLQKEKYLPCEYCMRMSLHFTYWGKKGWGNIVPVRELVYGKALEVRKNMGIVSKYYLPVSPQEENM